jgi:hypothetical protein
MEDLSMKNQNNKIFRKYMTGGTNDINVGKMFIKKTQAKVVK